MAVSKSILLTMTTASLLVGCGKTTPDAAPPVAAVAPPAAPAAQPAVPAPPPPVPACDQLKDASWRGTVAGEDRVLALVGRTWKIQSEYTFRNTGKTVRNDLIIIETGSPKSEGAECIYPVRSVTVKSWPGVCNGTIGDGLSKDSIAFQAEHCIELSEVRVKPDLKGVEFGMKPDEAVKPVITLEGSVWLDAARAKRTAQLVGSGGDAARAQALEKIATSVKLMNGSYWSADVGTPVAAGVPANSGSGGSGASVGGEAHAPSGAAGGASPTSKANPAATGVPFLVNNLETTVNSARVSFQASSSGLTTYRATDGAKLVLVNYTVKNVSKQPIACLSFADAVLDADGVEYQDTVDCNMAVHNWALEKVNPGLPKKFEACFEVPKTSSGFTLKFNCDNVDAFVKLGL